MRFVISIILIALYIFILLATTKGINGISILIGYLIGSLLAPALIAGLFCIPKSKRNNKRFFRVFNIVLFVAILGQYGNLAKVIETVNKPPQEIIGSNSKIKMVVPNSWVSKEPPNEHVVLNLSDKTGYLNIIVGYEYTGDDRLDLKHYAQIIGNNFRKKAPDFESISSIEKCDSTQLDCVFQIANSTTGEKGATAILASLNGEDGYYNFMAITNPGLVDTYKKDIFSALSSLSETHK